MNDDDFIDRNVDVMDVGRDAFDFKLVLRVSWSRGKRAINFPCTFESIAMAAMQISIPA